MLKKSVFYCFSAVLLCSILSTTVFATMGTDRIPIAHSWPTFAGTAKQIETYTDPNSPEGSTGSGQRVQENFNSNRGVTQSFTNPITNDGFTLTHLVMTEGGGLGHEENTYSVHLFDINTAAQTPGGATGLVAWQTSGGYAPATDALPQAYDWLSTDCTFIFWPDDNEVGGVETANDWFVIFSFDGYDKMDIEPNHLYVMEIWGPQAADARMYWIRDAIDHYAEGRAYEVSGTTDGPLPGVGPADLSAGRTGIAGAARDMTLAVYGVLADGNAYHPTPRNLEPDAGVTGALTWSPGKWVASTQGHRVWFSTALAMVQNRLPAANKGYFDACEYNPGTLAFQTTYYWRVDEYNSVSKPGSYWGGPVWQFTTTGPQAKNPNPASNSTAEFALTDFNLRWTKGAWAADTDGHAVYFGTDATEVNEATTATATIYRGAQTSTAYDLLDLAGDYTLTAGTRYYWRVDEVNGVNTWKGPLWNFLMSDFVSIDTFGYGSQTDMNAVWRKGDNTCLEGGDIGGVPVLTGGRLELTYDNSASAGLPWTEIRADNGGAGLGMDWTVSDIVNTASLSIGFSGTISNSVDPDYDNLYVAIEDGSGQFNIVYCQDKYIQKRQFANPTARYWDIPFATLTNNGTVDLTDINALYIGFGPRCDWGPREWGPYGGTGVVNIDNIRLYIPRCLTEYGGFNGPAGSADLASIYVGSGTNWGPGDCTVNYFDLDYMFYNNTPSNDAKTWLAQDETLEYTGTAPLNDAGHLTVWYKFDDQSGSSDVVTDSSGNNRHGTIGNPHSLLWATDGVSGNCLNFEAGFRTWVDCPTSVYPDPNNNPGATGVTFCFWSAYDMNYQPTEALGATWGSIFTFHTEVPTEANATTNNDDSQLVESQFPTPWPPQSHQWGPQFRFVDLRNNSGDADVARPGDPWVRPDHFGKRWNHFALVYDDANDFKAVYQNGQLVGSSITDTNVPLPLWPAVGSFRLGTRSNRFYNPGGGIEGPNWGFWYGKLDDFRIYNYALTESEIQWLTMNGQPSRVIKLLDNADLNSDAIINFKDYALLMQQWLTTEMWP